MALSSPLLTHRSVLRGEPIKPHRTNDTDHSLALHTQSSILGMRLSTPIDPHKWKGEQRKDES